MKNYAHLWQYLAEFFLEWEMFLTKVVDKIKSHILCAITSYRKSCGLWDNVEKFGTARQATDDNIIQRMRFTCWITKATDTHSEYVILTAFPQQLITRTRLNIMLYVHCLCYSCHNKHVCMERLLCIGLLHCHEWNNVKTYGTSEFYSVSPSK
jgi:hypothetical protein